MILIPEKSQVVRIRLGGYYWVKFQGERAVPAMCTEVFSEPQVPGFGFTIFSAAHVQGERTRIVVNMGAEAEVIILPMNEPVIETDEEE